MTNKKNDHVLYLEERIEWLERSMIKLIDMAEHNRHYTTIKTIKTMPNLTKEIRGYNEIQSKLPVKEIDKLDNAGGRA